MDLRGAFGFTFVVACCCRTSETACKRKELDVTNSFHCYFVCCSNLYSVFFLRKLIWHMSLLTSFSDSFATRHFSHASGILRTRFKPKISTYSTVEKSTKLALFCRVMHA